MEKAMQITAQVSLVSIELTGWNPRKHFDAAQLDELTESVRQHGVLQPILLRPKPGSANGMHQLVAGERRFRAALAAGLYEIPATIRELTDREVLEIMLSENLQRADLHPLEEAEAYHRLHELYGCTVDELAAKAGKSRTYVYARMRLWALPERVKHLLLGGELDVARANLIARIHNAELAEQAAMDITRLEMRTAEAEAHIRDRYMLRLRGAPFPTGKPELIRSAGACVTCPKRSGAQNDLFGEVSEKDDLCLDPACFRQKIDAEAALRIREATKRGLAVLPKGEANQVFRQYDSNGSVRHGAPYVNAREKSWAFQDKSPKSVLGADAPPVVMAVNPHTGRAVELYRKADVERILKEKRGTRGEKKPADHALAEQRKREKIRAEVRRRLVEKLVGAAESAEPEGFWQVLTEGAIARAWHDTLKDVCIRRGIDRQGKKAGACAAARVRRGLGDIVVEYSRGLTHEQLRGLAVEIILGTFVSPDDSWKESRILSDAILSAFGVDPKPTAMAVRKELGARKKAPSAKRGSGRGRRSRPRKEAAEDGARRCRVCGCTDDDCRGCIERTGEPCHSVEEDLCSACVGEAAGTLRNDSLQQ